MRKFSKIISNLKFARYRSVLSPAVLNSTRCDDVCTTKKKDNICKKENPWLNLRSERCDNSHKVTVVGAGDVGTACVNNLVLRNICKHVVWIDNNLNKLEGEVLEYLQGSMFLDGCKVEASPDYAASRNSNVIIVCAGDKPKHEESRLHLTQKNAQVFKEIIPLLYELSQEAVFVIVTNPVDVLSWLTWKLTCTPVYKVIGSGTLIDTARFKFHLSQELNCDINSLNALILGEHGDSQVPIWSQVIYDNCRRLRDEYPNCGLCPGERFTNISEAVKKANKHLMCTKGSSNTLVAMSVACIVQSLLYNIQKIRPLSTLAQGFYGIDKEVFLSLPCEIDEKGVQRIYREQLDEYEIQQMQTSANILHEAQCQIKI